MQLTVRARLTYRFCAPCEVLLLIEAARSADQAVRSEHLVITPAPAPARLDDSVTGERRVAFLAEGDVDIDYDAEIEVMPRASEMKGVAATPIRDLPADALRYLRASRYCPSDRFEAFSSRQFGTLRGGDRVQAILDWIAGNIEYCAGVSDATTTALDTFVDRAGVCRDFAHLAIALCRAGDIPARAVSAYGWQLDPPDMHAVAEVYLGGRWRLIDPTGKVGVDGLVRVATGMDAADIAFMTVFGHAYLLSQTFSVRQGWSPPEEAEPQKDVSEAA